MKSKYKLLALFLGLFLFGIFLPKTLPANAATDGSFNLVAPNNGNLVEGCTYSLDIRINTGTNNSNSADIIVLYQPSKVEILDSIASKPDVQIKPGNAYETYFGNVIDSNNGVIRLTGASLSENFRGEEIFATIEFRAKPDTTSSSFTVKFDGPSDTNTLDSNIAVAETSLDALGSVTNANLNFIKGNCINDTTAPNINYINPTNNQKGVPLNQNVQINLTDNLSGVDLSTLQILINGLPYVVSDPEVQITGSTNNYNVVINPREDFYANAPSSIVVSVTDFAGNNRQSNISFNFPEQPVPTVNPTIIYPTPTIIQPSPTIIYPSPTIIEPGPTIIQPSPIVIQPTPTIIQPSPVVIQPTPTVIIVTPTDSPSVSPTPVVVAPGDIIPPVIQFVNPISRQTVTNKSTVVIVLKDDGSGINIDTLQILINERRYTNKDFTVSISGDKSEYTITIKDDFNFSKISSSYITAFISDLAGNSTVNNIVFNTPEIEVLPEEKVCKELVEEGSSGPIKSAPFKDVISNFQSSIENILPDAIKPFIKDTGLLGLLSLILASPFLLWLLSVLFSFLAGGLLLPFLLGMFASNRNKYGVTINSITKEAIALVKINVYDKKTGALVIKTVSNLRGRFYLDLKPGEYKIDFIKKAYDLKTLEINITEKTRLLNIVELNKLELSTDLAGDLQFRTLKVDPRIITVYLGLLLAFLNLFYTRTVFSMIILGMLILAALIFPKKFKKVGR